MDWLSATEAVRVALITGMCGIGIELVRQRKTQNKIKEALTPGGERESLADDVKAMRAELSAIRVDVNGLATRVSVVEARVEQHERDDFRHRTHRRSW